MQNDRYLGTVVRSLVRYFDEHGTFPYAHLANDPLRAAADRIAGEIAAALDGGPLAEVVPIRIAADPERR